MKIACVTTTINIPRVLALYAKYSPEVFLIVIGDRKTDDTAVVNFLTEHVPNHAYYGVDYQRHLGWECAALIPENCIQRRSIGFLEALKWGAEIIVTIDDDNLPMEYMYFEHHRNALVCPFDGLQATSTTGWLDSGQLLVPKAPQRGVPYPRIAEPVFESVVGAQVGVCAGMCLGDPDIGAVERITNGPIVHGISEVLRHGFVVDPRTATTVFNSQNTAFRRELVPTMMMLTAVGRYDDIFAGLVCQRVMADLGLCVRHGKPAIWQQRNPHDLNNDLVAEIEGMRLIERFHARLAGAATALQSTVLGKTRVLFEETASLLPLSTGKAWDAWLRDCEKVM